MGGDDGGGEHAVLTTAACSHSDGGDRLMGAPSCTTPAQERGPPHWRGGDGMIK